MKIVQNSQTRLVIKESQTTHIAMAIIFTVIGFLPALGITLEDGFFPGAIMPTLILVGGLVMWKFNTHPHLLIFDRGTHELKIKEPDGFGNRYKETVLTLEDIEMIDVKKGKMQFANGTRKVFNNYARLKNGKNIELLPNYNRKQSRYASAKAMQDFLGLKHGRFQS